ncbi:GNAT family N-acetyltransferase [Neoroseomonas oryzicola]|uniref:GNAT family N-acetyltransferase n=1 Tax=Neoroseomonas oryzicola TaxID=535904 RepID=A0A9X9WD02_9PROT|nr:GNAT family N-acetyltransferase [Neoroseomonas oryzicola]NKE15971.1 GNAT family N-acetyltransferase [Neoroseomonas oryzicola]
MPALRIVQRAVLDLRARNGIGVSSPASPPHFQRLCLQEDPSGVWVAEADGVLQGFAFSWMIGRFWFLAQLFIDPGVQARGIGQALLSRTLEQAARRGADNHALITFAYNRASTGLYIRHGIYPREPLYRFEAPAQTVRLPSVPPSLEVVPMQSGGPAPAWLGEIDELVLGFRRDAHHQMLLGTGLRALGFIRAGRPVGYAYVSGAGHVGPMAVAPGTDPAAAGVLALHEAKATAAEYVSILAPGRAAALLAMITEAGLRLAEPMVILAARPFGEWDRYVPMNPGYM